MLRAIVCNGPLAGLDDQVTELPDLVATRRCADCPRPHLWPAGDDDSDVYALVDVTDGVGFYEHVGSLVDELLDAVAAGA